MAMVKIKVYIHGVPIGHEMCGCETKEERKYLEQFYDLKSTVDTLLVIDILEGTSYYTYLKKGNFSNQEGRPNSYFGITVSFGNQTCDNVYVLYDILEQVYTKVVLKTLVKESNNGASFIVRQIETAKIQNLSAIEFITQIVEKNIINLVGEAFTPINGNISTSGRISFNLAEVDSPLFHNAVNTKRVIVSANFPSSSNALVALNQKIAPIENENSQLKGENELLHKNEKVLKKEINDLRLQLKQAEETSSQKHRDHLSKVQQELDKVTEERNNLKDKMDKAVEAIDLIQEPSEKLIHLLASRFRKEGSLDNQYPAKENHSNRKKDKYLVWLPICNTILLLFACVFSIIIICSLRHSFVNANVDSVKGNQIGQQVGTEGSIETCDAVSTDSSTYNNNVDSNPEIGYDDCSKCKIDIKNFSEDKGLKKETNYMLSIMYSTKIKDKKITRLANLPSGEYEVNGPASVVNNQLTLLPEAKTGDLVLLSYKVNGKTIRRSSPLKVK